MTKIYLIFLFLPSLLLSSDFFKISSVNFDLVGVVASGNKIAAYGTKGSVYYSDDGAQNWKIIKPFETGNIVNFFIENDRFIAFMQTGEVSQSYDNGLNWSVTNPINDSISYVIKGNNDYYVRAKNSILKLSENLTLLNTYHYSYNFGFNITYHYLARNRRFMTFIENKLFLIDTSLSSFIVFDSNLKKLHTLDFKKRLLESDCYMTNIINDSKDLIFQCFNYSLDSSYIYKLNTDLTEIKVLHNISDSKEKKRKLFKENSPNVNYYSFFNQKLYTLNNFLDSNYLGPFYNLFELYSKDSAVHKGVIDASVGYGSVAAQFDFTDFVVENDRFTGVSKNNFIVSKKLNSNSTERISSLNGAGSSSNLFKLNDSDYLLLTPINIYRSHDTTKTFQKVIGDSAVFRSYLKLDLRFNYYDNDKMKLIYFAYSFGRKDSSFVYISDDFGDKFTEKQLQNLSFNNLANKYTIVKVGRKYIIAEYQNGPITYNYYDENFNFINSKVESNYRYSYLSSDNLEDYTIIGSNINLQDNNRYLKSTTDGGETWNDIRTFSFSKDTVWYNDSTQYFTTITNHLRYNKSIDYDGKSYVLLVTYNRIDSLYKIEAMDLQTNEFSLIYQNKQGSYSNTIVELIDGTYYICKDDTLFTTSNLFDYNSWQGQKLPNNGTMLNRIMKSGDYLITYYFDDIHPYDIYRIKWNELSITSITEEDIEVPPYFYNSAPFPLPTSTYVSTKIYMDNNVTITKESIKIYDINGTQVENGNKVEISNTVWPTTLTWDSSNQPPGVYFILIEYDGNSKAIKVMKE